MPESDNPLIVQSDRTLLLDVHAGRAKECADSLIPFAELIRSPEHLHTYQITPLSLWNAASAGFTTQNVIKVLAEYSRYDIPQSVQVWIEETAGRFGKLRLVPGPVFSQESIMEEYLYLVSTSPYVYKEIQSNAFAKTFLSDCTYKAVPESTAVLSEEEKNIASCCALQTVER